jgi:hypothetical protein
LLSDTKSKLSLWLDRGTGSQTRGTLYVGLPFPRRPATKKEAAALLKNIEDGVPFTHAAGSEPSAINELTKALKILLGTATATFPAHTGLIAPVALLAGHAGPTTVRVLASKGSLSSDGLSTILWSDTGAKLATFGAEKTFSEIAPGLLAGFDSDPFGADRVYDKEGALLATFADRVQPHSVRATASGFAALSGTDATLYDSAGQVKQTLGAATSLRVAADGRVITLDAQGATIFDANGVQQQRILGSFSTFELSPSGALLLGEQGQPMRLFDTSGAQIASINGRFVSFFSRDNILVEETDALGAKSGATYRADGTAMTELEGEPVSWSNAGVLTRSGNGFVFFRTNVNAAGAFMVVTAALASTATHALLTDANQFGQNAHIVLASQNDVQVYSQDGFEAARISTGAAATLSSAGDRLAVSANGATPTVWTLL